MNDKLVSLRVEGSLAMEEFSHCYVSQSVDIKSDANALIDKFGLGLRKKRIHSHSTAGCVFVLVNHGGPSGIMQKRVGGPLAPPPPAATKPAASATAAAA